MVVEVSVGDFNYCNPGAMGDIEEFEFAVDAAQRAIELQKKWQEHNPGEEVFVGHGYTGGHTMPFDPEEPEELLDWAKQRDDALPCCDQCGTKMPNKESIFCLSEYQDLRKHAIYSVLKVGDRIPMIIAITLKSPDYSFKNKPKRIKQVPFLSKDNSVL